MRKWEEDRDEAGITGAQKQKRAFPCLINIYRKCLPIYLLKILYASCVFHLFHVTVYSSHEKCMCQVNVDLHVNCICLPCLEMKKRNLLFSS